MNLFKGIEVSVKKVSHAIEERYLSYKYEKMIKKFKVDNIDKVQVKKAINEISAYQEIIYVNQRERIIIEDIKRETSKLNRNNVTRTNAYIQFYRKFPKLHWSFLAHMVSRNGGWNMTDLKGSIVSEVLNSNEQQDFFTFLEKSNAYIFLDAYPQLLLYEKSVNIGKSLFHLLPIFGVSKFMIPFWEHYYINGNSQMITVALIINEQHFIEKKVVENHYFTKNVFNTWQYKTQELFQLTNVIFPYKDNKEKVRLVGRKVKGFQKVRERVAVGKQLYAILFGLKDHVYQFANEIVHTGSRADYWPSTFSRHKLAENEEIVNEAKGNNPRIYSPTLEKAWGDVSWKRPRNSDWFTQEIDVSPLFETEELPKRIDLTKKYEHELQTLHFVVIAKKNSI
ncbi:DUF2515 domain-containing protein [Evansella cellulosilytica]|uniref:DUF2515 domain-containing protein n=1 Tax=Evansella cellulosilytica (strain ATCC 21833 / DSM 2522 / FERM P-1141 / JCM 9156 / N-4) TaxID=649639 RepID=E6U0Y3_EVAC2|nr:DUF2515 domain-containing protein [Evansella cellulosilytica]ADU30295.1 Protein of unknown function DUF2515 [Evansella cellulosilytica DSM 2522]